MSSAGLAAAAVALQGRDPTDNEVVKKWNNGIVPRRPCTAHDWC